MKYLIDIGHPAHVHYFKNLALRLAQDGDDILFTCRDKEITIALLNALGFNYISFGKPFNSKIGKLIGLFYFTIRMFFTTIRFKPHIVINASIYAAFVAWILRKPHISIEDTFNSEQVRLYLPFTSSVLTGAYSHPELGQKEIKYHGYQELLYLHPNIFKPDISVFRYLNIDHSTQFVIVRFVSWNASHDFGHKGISYQNKIRAVKEFSKFAKVFISSEGTLPKELEKFRSPLPPQKMHDALAFAKLIFGESSTMVSEGAMLGVPGIFLDNSGRFYTSDQEDKYELVYNYSESMEDQEKAINKGIALLKDPNTKSLWKIKRNKMLSENIDVSSFFYWFVKDYPNSVMIMKSNPIYQFKFK